ncbi:MAG: plasmid pRiA4b ORF-3 family protein, partial [Desulfobacterales bacterium]|nr:plasmid pRiA4b ORF-3 family protein [Desulfobacterales bacterium]
FDDDHLYMFSMNRKRYDREGYYHPGYDGRKNATKVKIYNLGLKVRNKFLYLYDFGDEWMFDIVVQKIEQSKAKTLTFVTEGKGEIYQYPDWEDEVWEEEEWDAIDDFEEERATGALYLKENESSMVELLSRKNSSELAKLMKALDIIPQKRKRGISYAYATEIVKEIKAHKEKIMDILTPRAAIMMLKIVEGEKDDILSSMEQINCMSILEYCGLVEIDESLEGIILSYTKEAKEFDEYLRSKDIKEELLRLYKWDMIISAIMNIYGVIETKYLHQLLCDYINLDIDFEIFKRKVLNQNVMWDEIQMFSIDDGKVSIASLYEIQETEYILRNRDKYKVKRYRKFDSDELLAVTAGDWTMLIPSFGFLSEHLLVDKDMY